SNIQRVLSAAMRTSGTSTLLSQAQFVPAATKSIQEGHKHGDDYYAVWDEFLGNADTDFHNASTPHYDDRLFTTGVAVNALIDSWSFQIDGAESRRVSIAWVDE